MEPQYEEEIDLMDYLKVIIKRKRLILTVFLVVIIVAGIFSFLSPKVYEVGTTLEIGRIRGQIIEPIPQIIEKIESGIYGRIPEMKVSSPKDTNFIKIELTSSEPQRTKKELANLTELILNEHNEKIDFQKDLLEKEIKRLEGNINFLLLRGQETAILQLEINNLERQRELFQPTKLVIEPTISEKTVSPNLVLNMVVAVILGLFIGIFLVFFQEWWEKNKTKLKTLDKDF